MKHIYFTYCFPLLPSFTSCSSLFSLLNWRHDTVNTSSMCDLQKTPKEDSKNITFCRHLCLCACRNPRSRAAHTHTQAYTRACTHAHQEEASNASRSGSSSSSSNNNSSSSSSSRRRRSRKRSRCSSSNNNNSSSSSNAKFVLHRTLLLSTALHLKRYKPFKQRMLTLTGMAWTPRQVLCQSRYRRHRPHCTTSL